MKILYVEDEISMRNVLEMVLTRLGHEVVTADNGKEGWEKFDETFDYVVTDLFMPVMDGHELIERIRAIDKDVKIIVTSNWDSLRRVNHVQRHMVNGFFIKAETPVHTIAEAIT